MPPTDEIPINLPFDQKLVALIKQHTLADPSPEKIGEVANSLAWHSCQLAIIHTTDIRLARKLLKDWNEQNFEKLRKQTEAN